jgi:hypothetical protein
LPSTLTTLDIQHSHVAELVLPFCYIPVEGDERQRLQRQRDLNAQHFLLYDPEFAALGEKTLAQLFPSLLNLSLLSNPLRRVLGLIMAPIRTPTIQNFFLSLPPSLISLAFSFGQYQEVIQAIPFLPPHLTTLSIACPHIHTGEFMLLPRFSDPPPPLRRLDLPMLRIFSGSTGQAAAAAALAELFNSLPHLDTLFIDTIQVDLLINLPKTLTRLGMQNPLVSHSWNVTTSWPPALKIFDSFFVPQSHQFHPLPPTIQTYALRSYSWNGEVKCYTHTLEGLGIRENPLAPPTFSNLTVLDLNPVSMLDNCISMIPSTVKILKLHTLLLSGHLILEIETMIPIVNHNFLIDAATRYLASSDLPFMVLFALGSPTFKIVELTRIPQGVEAIDESLDLRYFKSLKSFPRSLKVLPKTIIPHESELEFLPPQLTAIDCDCIYLPTTKANILPASLTRIKTIEWVVYGAQLSEILPDNIDQLVLIDDIPKYLGLKYLPHLTNTKFLLKSYGHDLVDFLPPTLTKLTVKGSHSWYRYKEKHLPASLTYLKLEDELRLGFEGFNARFPVHLVLLSLAGKPGEQLLYGGVAEYVLPNLVKLKIAGCRPLHKRMAKFGQIAPNLQTLILRGKLLLHDSMILTSDEMFPPHLTRLHLDTSFLTKECAPKFPVSLSRLDLAQESEISGETLLKLIHTTS